MHLTTHKLTCPYCGARIRLLVDETAGYQQYVEDCEVCCQPMVVCVETDFGDGCQVSLTDEDEALWTDY